MFQQVLDLRTEGRERLGFGAAVDADQYRHFFAGFESGRTVVKRGNAAAVETLEAHQRRCGERRGIETADFAGGPAGQFGLADVDDIDIARRSRGIDAHGQTPAVRRELQAAADADGKLRQRHRFQTGGVDQTHGGDAVLIRDVGQAAAIGALREGGHIPGDVLADDGGFSGSRIMMAQVLEFGFFIRNEIHAFAVARVFESAEGGFAAVNREQRQFSGGDIDLARTGIIGGQILADQ